MVKCLKKYKGPLIGFYFYVVATVYVSQMMLWSSGATGNANNCRNEQAPSWWWLIINVCLFYLMVVYGFATWGAYICGVQDVKEEIIQSAVDEYLKSGVYQRK